MAQVECSRCKRRAAGLPSAPLPGAAGERVLARVCAACWSEWLAAQVILINEHSLSPADPAHYQKLLSEMDAFLGIGDAG